VPATNDVQGLYTRRGHAYVSYVQAFRHRQGLAAVLASSTALGLDQRILDAGCGTGLSILAMIEALHRRGFRHRSIDAFDLTPAMLERCKATLEANGVPRVELRQADVLHLDEQLPAGWTGYDLIVCASMLEYVPPHLLSKALAGLGERLAPGGRLVVVITRKLFYFTRWIWRCEGYGAGEIRAVMAKAGLSRGVLRYYPATYGWLNVGNHVIEAKATTRNHA